MMAEHTGNALYFRDWRDGSTFSQYLNLTPPNDYEFEPGLRQCFATSSQRKSGFHFVASALYEGMNANAFMEEGARRAR